MARAAAKWGVSEAAVLGKASTRLVKVREK